MKTLLLTFSAIIFLFSSFQVNAQTIHLGSKQQYGVKALNNPNATVGGLVTSALQILFIFAALAVLIFIVWAAFDWITSGGDKEKVAAARRKVTNAIIGLFLLALASFITVLVGDLVGINPFNMGVIPQLGQQTLPTNSTQTTP